MKKILICLLFILVLTGCNSSKENLIVNCEKKESYIELKTGNTFTCELMNNEYKFTIDSIKDDIVTLKVNKVGLTKYNDNGTINLMKEIKEFKVEKEKELNLTTQTEDYSEYIIISW